MRVLVVDDDDDVRSLVRRIIELEGDHECHEAATGADALEAWRAQRHDLVVLDHRMPDMAGIDVAATMHSEAPEQHVVLTTAYVGPEVVDAATAAGVHAVILKDMRLSTRLGEVLHELGAGAR